MDLPGKDKPRIRIIFYSTWADRAQDASSYLNELPARDLSTRVSDPSNPSLLKLAKLDCDWDGECLRSFHSMQEPHIDFLPAIMTGPMGLLDIISRDFPGDETRWLILIGQRPSTIDSGIAQILQIFTGRGGRVFYWSFDEASREMKCFSSIAPYLSILIHDEFPLDPKGESRLPRSCKKLHHSWVANMIPFQTPFEEAPEKKILFLGSQLGMTSERTRQVEVLKNHFKDRFLGIHDHSIPVKDRYAFSKIKVHFCPEGRKFKTPGMSQTHTDRTFWAGCLGQVPVVENSQQGNRLEDLFQKKLIFRYSHENENELMEACEAALECSTAQRKQIFQFFNEFETVGNCAARMIAEFSQN